MIRFFQIIVWLTLLTQTVQGQSFPKGIPFIDYFSPDDYQGGIINYKIEQDERGFILVANNSGLLEYDGSHWRKLEMDVKQSVRSILPMESGRIYVGSVNELGYFSADEQGKYVFHSLKHLVPEAQQGFMEVWDIYDTNEGIVFTTVHGILRYSNDEIEFIPYLRPNMLSYQFKNRIYNQMMEAGLFELHDGNWMMRHQGDFFAFKEIRSIDSYNDKFDLISTYEHGLFLKGKHEVIPWATSLREQFIEDKIICTKRLSDGNYAIGTNGGGVYIVDQAGHLVEHWSKASGLKSKTVLDILEDTMGNIWLGHNNGISKIEYDSPFRLLNEKVGIEGTGYVAFSYEDYVYFGTNNGLYYAQIGGERKTFEVKKMKGIEGLIYNIQELDGDILVGGHTGAFQIKDFKAHRISDGFGWWTFVTTYNSRVAIAGGYSGLFLMKKNDLGYWEVIKHFSGFYESSRLIAFDDNYKLWMSHGHKGIYSFDFCQDFETIDEIKLYDENHGLPSHIGNNLFSVDGEIICSTINGIYVYDQESDAFVPHDFYKNYIHPTTHVRHVHEGDLGDVFLISDRYCGRLKKQQRSHVLDSTSLLKIFNLLNDDLENISSVQQNKLIFSARDGFVLYDNLYESSPFDFEVFLRRIQLTTTDSLLFDGNFMIDGRIEKKQPESAIPSIDYANNSIHFSYSALEFDEQASEYSYRLVGLDDKWSDWTATHDKEFMGLYEGKYQFEVRAKNVNGTVSNVTSYAFEILAPWYRALPMLLLYALALLAALLYVVAYVKRSRQVISEQQNVLDNQGRQLKEVSEKSEEEINRLKQAKLMDDIRHKKNQLAISAMSLITRNDFIISIQKSLRELIPDVETPKIQSRLKKIIAQIDKDKKSNQDFHQFEMLFDEAHSEFSKNMKANFPALTSHELRLCMYLRLNLSTKEIANLSHVSPRAIEMSRYRMRKKLGLGKDENLITFLMGI